MTQQRVDHRMGRIDVVESRADDRLGGLEPNRIGDRLLFTDDPLAGIDLGLEHAPHLAVPDVLLGERRAGREQETAAAVDDIGGEDHLRPELFQADLFSHGYLARVGYRPDRGRLERGPASADARKVDPRPDRAFYRLVYPLSLRPTVLIGQDRFVVVDLSERGLQFLHPGDVPPLGEALIGRLFLPDAAPIEIEGTVIRRRGSHVALALSRGVPFSVMLEQQRLLQRRLLTWR